MTSTKFHPQDEIEISTTEPSNPPNLLQDSLTRTRSWENITDEIFPEVSTDPSSTLLADPVVSEDLSTVGSSTISVDRPDTDPLDLEEDLIQPRLEGRDTSNTSLLTDPVVNSQDGNNTTAQVSRDSNGTSVESREASRRHNLDVSLLARHIEHMQRICRASLEDLPQSRQRRQVIRLQGIRRMLEDLQRQIRNLQVFFSI